MATTFYWSTAQTDITGVAPTNSEIIISNVYRPLIKPMTRHRVEIPGRVGSWNFEGGVARDYTISVDLIITGARSSDIQACAAQIENTLSDNKPQPLVFSDSTGTTHQAQIYSEITLTPEGPGNVARATLEFECDAST